MKILLVTFGMGRRRPRGDPRRSGSNPSHTLQDTRGMSGGACMDDCSSM